MQARIRDIQRATEELKGVVAGIACDYQMSDAEIGALRGWLDIHANLCNVEPFKELSDFLKRIIADQVIEEDEREDLMAWCLNFGNSELPAAKTVTAAIRRLHGFLQGLALDGEVTEQEVYDLKDWLHDHESVRYHWPFSDVWDLTTRILKDGRVTDAERKRILEYCTEFAETPIDREFVQDKPNPVTEPFMISDAPVLLTLDMVCAKNPTIVFKDNSFCFTGHASFGKRKDLQSVTESLGGIVTNNIVLDLNFLVVGALSQPVWIYSTYGRKIEAAIANQRRGAGTLIVHEEVWLRAAREHA